MLFIGAFWCIGTGEWVEGILFLLCLEANVEARILIELFLSGSEVQKTPLESKDVRQGRKSSQ